MFQIIRLIGFRLPRSPTRIWTAFTVYCVNTVNVYSLYFLPPTSNLDIMISPTLFLIYFSVTLLTVPAGPRRRWCRRWCRCWWARGAARAGWAGRGAWRRAGSSPGPACGGRSSGPGSSGAGGRGRGRGRPTTLPGCAWCDLNTCNNVDRGCYTSICLLKVQYHVYLPSKSNLPDHAEAVISCKTSTRYTIFMEKSDQDFMEPFSFSIFNIK